MYLGCNSYVDAEIGRVIDAVHRYVPDNTWIIFTSDHGEMLGAHHLTGKGPVMYEEIAHIPLIIERPASSVVPGARDARRVQTCGEPYRPVAHADGACGDGHPPILEGDSLVPVLMGRKSRIETWS